MRIGDLVKLKSVIYHTTGVYRQGLIGVVTGVIYPATGDERAFVDVNFKGGKVSCHWDEVEIFSESR